MMDALTLVNVNLMKFNLSRISFLNSLLKITKTPSALKLKIPIIELKAHRPST